MNTSNIPFPSAIQIRDIIERVFLNQETLNVRAYSVDWRANAYTGKFDYPLAAGFEIIELGNSWNLWNWWSKSTPGEFELLNMRVEAVDALHFIASDIIACYGNDLQAMQIEAAEMLSYVQRTLPVFQTEEEEVKYITARIKELLRYAGSMVSTRVNALQALESLYRLAIHACGLGLRELSTMYFAKSTLNQFRQDHGYREKKYTKIWKHSPKLGPIEDNHVLMNWVSNESVLPKNAEVYTWLQTEYAKVLAEKAAKEEAARKAAAINNGQGQPSVATPN